MNFNGVVSEVSNVQCLPCLCVDWVNIYTQVCALGQCQDASL